MIAAVAMMVSCSGNQSGNKAAGDDNAKGFSVQNGITSTTGSKNCFLAKMGAPIQFEVTGEGDILDVTATVKVIHSEKTEVEELTKPVELRISGKDDDNKDVKLTLIADDASQSKIAEWLNKPAGEEVVMVFKAKLPKADMDKLNAKKCNNSLVF